jgi:hypothetical protein
MNSTIVANFLSSLGTSDFESWILVQQAYRDHAWGEEIFETGFNTSSGYVYIALENGVQICSCFGQDVDYCVYDFETGEEHFFDTYDEAMEHLNNN